VGWGGKTAQAATEQGKRGDLAGRASESSTVRPVWGRRHLLRENKGGCVALSGHVSRTGALANKKGSVQTERTLCLLRHRFLHRPVRCRGGSDQ